MRQSFFRDRSIFKSMLKAMIMCSIIILIVLSARDHQRMDDVVCVDISGHEIHSSDLTGEWRYRICTTLINSKTGDFIVIGSSYEKPFNSGEDLLKKHAGYDTYAYGSTRGWTNQDMLDWLAAGRPICKVDPKTADLVWDRSLLMANNKPESKEADLLKNATTVYEGKDYKDSYNAFTYYNNYPDLQKAFGTDANALIKHYVEYGIAEGRKAK